MRLTLGIKTDPVEYRYSYEWLFDLLAELSIPYIQLGSFCEMYLLPDEYFIDLREQAKQRGLRIKSLFTSHRELGGFMTGNKYLEKTARRCYERLIEIAGIIGVDFVGSSIGACYRDQMSYKQKGIDCYLKNMKELMHFAFGRGLTALTVEPMSCLAEPPTLPDETEYVMQNLRNYHKSHKNTLPFGLCSDISHGYADENKRVIHDNWSLFSQQIPWMYEFHFKNTDNIFNSTFGFLPHEIEKGIVDLAKFKELLNQPEANWPLPEITGYLEIGGPKLGRDYTDKELPAMLKGSLQALKKVFG